MTSPTLLNKKVAILLTSVFIIAICGILYELLISTISSYFQGSSVLHFSLVIGLFLSFMGVGSYTSRFIKEDLLTWFIRIEILLGLVGGFSAFLLYFAYSLTPYFYLIAFVLIALLGGMIGVEIPILTRIVRQYETLREAMASVLTFDYLGALIASVAFPLILLPTMGLMRTAFAIGWLNLLVAIMNIWLFRKELINYQRMMGVSVAIMVVLIGGFAYSLSMVGFFERFLYNDPILFTRQSTYQRIVLTKYNQDVRLFLDGNLQFSSRDEYRYHEPLVHIPVALALSQERVLVLGGGDGLVIRELLKHQGIQHIDLVDLDPEMTRLGTTHPAIRELNGHAMHDARVHIFNQDAYKFVEKSSDLYDIVIIDLPDPNHVALGKLYSKEFYHLLEKRMAIGATLVTQSTSPYFATQAFWCIHHTLASVFPQTIPYTVYVPSFGQWGFNLSIRAPGRLKIHAPDSTTLVQQTVRAVDQRLFRQPQTIPLQYLNPEVLPGLFHFPEDMKEVQTEVNQIDNQRLIQYYEASWNQWR